MGAAGSGTTPTSREIVAVVERKSLADLVHRPREGRPESLCHAGVDHEQRMTDAVQQGVGHIGLASVDVQFLTEDEHGALVDANGVSQTHRDHTS